jgi:hypothetical protein
MSDKDKEELKKQLKVTKVDKKNRTVTVDTCVDFKTVPIIELPIWSGTIHSLDELFGITEELTKEELQKKYPKGGEKMNNNNLEKCIKLLQNDSVYTTKIIAELLELDLKYNDGNILAGLEHDLWILDNIINKGE